MKDNKQELDLLLKLTKLMQKLSINCRIKLLEHFVSRVEMNIWYNERHQECYCGKC